ncbi:MAG: hypothetical protein IPI51_07205, partial [Betaproteobacteria bacterium]|nr:hypothetical protein [Betaproteobacteria bacterium]
IFRCVDGSTVDWIVEYDGRIPAAAKCYLSTACDGESPLTASIPTSFSGVWTAEISAGVAVDTGASKMTARRAGRYSVMLKARQKDNVAAVGDIMACGLYLNGTTTWKAYISGVSASASDLIPIAAYSFCDLAAGDYVVFHYVTTSGSKGLTAATSDVYTGFGLSEVL